MHGVVVLPALDAIRSVTVACLKWQIMRKFIVVA